MGSIRTDIDPLSLLAAISDLSETYPGFREWYLSKVIPGIKDGTRIVFAEASGSRLTGVAIAKRSGPELKLCTLWKDPSADGGTATMLVRSVMQWLGTDRPSFTVPQDRIQRLRPVLNELGIGAGIAVGQIYRPGVEEFLFNAQAMHLGTGAA